MENEIKVNEYVRIAGGIIARITNKNKDGLLIDRVIRDPMRQDGTIRDWCIFNDEKALIVKHSPNLIDIIEDEDFCKIEFYSPRYEKRGTRIFEVSKIDEYITFENMHCDLFMINGEWSNNDKRLNPVIKEIYTKEMIESISYKVKE